jgi:hypothetical protein
MRKARVKHLKMRPGDRPQLCHALGPRPSTAPEKGRVVHNLSSLTSPTVLRFLLALLLVATVAAPSSAIDVVGDDLADEYVISGSVILNDSAADARDAVACANCHWRVVEICAGGWLDERRGCEQLQFPCDAGVAEVWRADAPALPAVGDPSWHYRGLMCLDTPPLPAAPIRELIPELARQAVPPLKPGAAPSPATLTNLRTAFYSGQSAFDPPPVTVSGAHVQLHLRPQWTWDFGHGTPLTTHLPGYAGPASPVTHVYVRRGIYRVVVTTLWAATYDVNGITGIEVSEPVKQSNWFDIRVKEARRYSIVPRSTT